MLTKGPPWVPWAPAEGDGALRGERLRSSAGMSSAHAWQIKEPVVAAEGRASVSIPPLIRSRIMATMMDCTGRVCRRKASKRQYKEDCQVPGRG